MGFYRKKPDIVTAIRLKKTMTIKTIHGELNGSPGDWLVSDAQGEQYFCKSEVFDEAYEEISAEELVELQKDGVLC